MSDDRAAQKTFTAALGETLKMEDRITDRIEELEKERDMYRDLARNEASEDGIDWLDRLNTERLREKARADDLAARIKELEKRTQDLTLYADLGWDKVTTLELRIEQLEAERDRSWNEAIEAAAQLCDSQLQPAFFVATEVRSLAKETE